MAWMVNKNDEEQFFLLCHAASVLDGTFANFRTREAMLGIVENVLGEEASVFIEDARRRWPERLQDSMPTLLALDAIGRQPISPTMIRYFYRACDLGDWCPSMNGGRIVEIGGGFGGLAAVINKLYQPASYAIVDVKPARDLQKRFLLEAEEKVTFLSPGQSPGKIDLLIADFSLCELSHEIRNQYATWLFPKADYGALLWSETDQEGWLTGDDVGEWLMNWFAASQICHLQNPPEQFAPSRFLNWWKWRWYWQPTPPRGREAEND